MECPVCVEFFTSHVRKPVTCPYCEYNACQQCQRTYLLQTMVDPHCMNCKRGWTNDFLRQIFPMSWIHGDYKRHRERCLFERERVRLPETQPMVSNYKLARSLRENIEKTNERVRVLRRELMDLRHQIDRDWSTVYRAEYNGYRGMIGNETTDRVRYIQTFPCPLEDCRGFVDSSNGLCGICDNVLCLQCGVIPEDTESHVCDENMVLNFAAIKKQTRSCPSCNAPTFKIDGCPQMFCTFCKTPWDWDTGTVIRGVLHNPHYFEWLRSQSEDGNIPRQPGDVPGGNRCENERVPGGYLLYQRLSADRQRMHQEDMGEYDRNTFQTVSSDLTFFCRRLIHISETQLRHLRNDDEDNADLRLQYLVNQLTEQQFKVKLQRREKKRNKEHEIADVYDMVIGVGGDILWAYIHEEKELVETHTSANRIRHYANSCLTQIGDRYKMSMLPFYV